MARRKQTMALGEYSWVLENGDSAVQGEACGIDTATNTVRPMGSSATMVFLGLFAEDLAGDGTKKVRVTLPGEIVADWFANSGTSAIAATDLGNDCYAEDGATASADDQTATLPKLGRILDFDSDRGRPVLVQLYPAV